MRQHYQDIAFRRESLNQIIVLNQILDEYRELGFKLTVRQLYYQMVARDYIPNTERSYKNITRLVNDGRLAGLIDWDMIEDRTREFVTRSRWTSPAAIVSACASQYHEDMWEPQDHRVFVIIEKEALVSVLERVCRNYDVPLLAARGYPSVSVLREFASQHVRLADQQIQIIHLGDHDPSGMDMTRDLISRISMLSGYDDFELDRIALNMDQIEELNPPPNPAKTTDARFKAYRAEFGSSSWELDALPPTYLEELVEGKIKSFIDEDRWAESEARVYEGREKLNQIAEQLND